VSRVSWRCARLRHLACSLRLGWNPREVHEAVDVLRHVDARWEMTTKQRLACGAAILRSIDARRQRTGNRNELLALEQAIVDRELIELDTRELCHEERELAREIALGSHMCRQPRGTRERVMRRICGGQTDEPNRA